MADTVIPRDINIYHPNEAAPFIVNPDESKKLNNDDEKDDKNRTKDGQLKAWGEPGRLCGDEGVNITTLNGRAFGDNSQPAVYIRIQTDYEVEPGEHVMVYVSELKMIGKPDDVKDGKTRLASLLIQHDCEEHKRPYGGQGRITLPLSASAPESIVHYPAGSDKAGPLPKASPLQYFVRGKGGVPIKAGEIQDLEVVVHNPTKSTVQYGGIDVWAKLGSGEHCLCTPEDRKKIDISTGVDGFVKAARSKNVDPQNTVAKDWVLIASFDAKDANKRVKPVFREIKSGGEAHIILKNVKVSQTAGTAELHITDWIWPGKRPPVQQFGKAAMVKMGGEFFFDYFSTDQPMIKSGQDGRLIWSAQNVKNFVLYDGKNMAQPIDNPATRAQDVKEIKETTGYVLEAYTADGLCYAQQAVLEVKDESVTLNRVTVKHPVDLNTPAYENRPPRKLNHNNFKSEEDLVLAVDKGDRYVMVAIEPNTKSLSASTSGAGIIVKVGGNPVGTLHLSPAAENVPLGFRLPVGKKTTIEPDSGWKEATESLESTLNLMVTVPRIPPNPPREEKKETKEKGKEEK
ncbi:hypothetical protein ACIQWR_41235 [Streptomyces sp. NPDC098789]|uniref:hypothetical protein n=1 Tax=Streptomyces sp. NPDC098789 TaxID=3366098 RepID=UPI00382AC93A